MPGEHGDVDFRGCRAARRDGGRAPGVGGGHVPADRQPHVAGVLGGALLTAWPGIVLQLVLVPALVLALRRARLME